MATHLEYVTGALGELTVLPCACGRVSDHPRLTSAALATPAAAVPDAALHSTGRRVRSLVSRPRATARATRSTRGRHAA